VPPDVTERLESFRADLRSDLAIDQIVQRHITYGQCYALDGAAYFELKRDISAAFGVHHSEVLVVGSGKLGFSIVSTKRFREFNDESDIDVAIVSKELFDAIWEDAYEFWRARPFWPGEEDFKRYLFRGWIRPDKLPPADTFRRRRDWWEFFRALTAGRKFGPYRVRGGVYRSWRFLEGYQTTCVAQCRHADR
jgi:hypothetical protein